jgi:FkbM family methyltransferase
MKDGPLIGSDTPLTSIILTTRDRPYLLSIALACYRHQTYRHRELVVVDDGEAFPADETAIAANGGRLIRVAPGTPLGTKLNRGVSEARGVLCQKMDDDDWYAPQFVEMMVAALLKSRRAICRPTLAFLMPFLFFDLAEWEVRRSVGSNVPGATLLFARDDWQEHGFRAVRRDEDVWFLLDQARAGRKMLPVHALEMFLAVRHQGGSRDRGHTWTHQEAGQTLEQYLTTRPIYQGGPEALLPEWAVTAYRELRRDQAAKPVHPSAIASPVTSRIVSPIRAAPVLARTLRLKNGSRFRIAVAARAKDPISRAAAYGEPWFLDDYSPLLELMRPGDTVLDLGGHIGTFSLAAAALGCRVICVEAAPENAALLEESVALNGFAQMCVVPAAVSDREGTLEFLPNGPWGTVANRAVLQSPALITADRVDAICVRSVTGDGLLLEFGWDRVDFLKIDIEGSEPAAIRGMTGLLGRDDSPIIFYESNGHALRFFGQTPEQLTAALETFGYISYVVDHGLLTPRRPGDFHAEGVVNCLAVKGPLPASPQWRVTGPRSVEETIAKIVAEARSTDVQHRAHIARILAAADPALLNDRRVEDTLRSLRRDRDAGVRSAAAWSGGDALARFRHAESGAGAVGAGRASGLPRHRLGTALLKALLPVPRSQLRG